MSFSTEKDKQSSTRFMLARLTPARYVGDVLASAGGGIYTMTWSQPIARVERNGVALTKTTGTPGSNDNWSLDETTGSFQIKLAGAPTSTTNVVVVFYYLFYTSGSGLYTYENPDDSTTTERFWQPRLLDLPSVTSSVKNAIFGVFSVADSTLKIANTDYAFQAFLTKNDSFNDADVSIWLCITDVTNRSKIFAGKAKALSFTSKDVSITIYDAFARLKQTAYFSDTADEAIFQKSATSFPNMDSRKHGQPCRLIVGKHSRWKTRPSAPDYVSSFEALDPDYLFEAVCTNYSASISTSTNRSWGLCRTTSDGIRTPAQWPVPSSVSTSSIGGSYCVTFALVYANATFATMDVVIGDLVNFSQAAKTSTYGRVVMFTVFGGNVTIYVQLSVATSPAYTTAVTITSVPAVSIVIQDTSGNLWFPRYSLDFTVAATTTSGGNKYYAITFVNSFEVNTPHTFSSGGGASYDDGSLIGLPILDPTKHRVFFRIRPDVTSASHGTVLKNLCAAAGITPTAATFAAADVAFAANVLMSVPFFDQTEYGEAIAYAQAICESTLGYLYLDSSNQAAYKLLAAPGAGTSKDDAGLTAFAVKVEYGDIITQVVAYNNHDYADVSSVASSATSSESTYARYLYGIQRVTQLVHVLDTIAARLPDHLLVRARPMVTYQLSTPTADLDTQISDDLTLSTRLLLGGGATQNVKVVSVTKGIKQASVEAIDLVGYD